MAGKEGGNLSSDKLFRIIECLAANRLPNRLTDLADKLDMPQPTLLRYLKTLCAQGYAYHDDVTGCYALTWKICRLADSVKSNLSLRSIASPFLNHAANVMNAGTLLAIEQDRGVLYLDFVDNPRRMMKTMLRIGKNAPIHTTASGKVLLSSFSYRKVEEIIAEKGLERLTENTITTPEKLFGELALIRKRGYAVDDEECEIGHRCIAVPIYDYSGNVAGAISAFDNIERVTDRRIETVLLPELKRTARRSPSDLGIHRTKCRKKANPVTFFKAAGLAFLCMDCPNTLKVANGELSLPQTPSARIPH